MEAVLALLGKLGDLIKKNWPWFAGGLAGGLVILLVLGACGPITNG